MSQQTKAGSLPVTLASDQELALPAGAATAAAQALASTAALQTTGNASLASILAAVGTPTSAVIVTLTVAGVTGGEVVLKGSGTGSATLAAYYAAGWIVASMSWNGVTIVAILHKP